MYILKYPYSEFISRIEKKLLRGNYKYFHELRIMIIRLLTKDEKKAKYHSLDEIEDATYNKSFILFLKILRIVKNCALMTLSLPYTIKFLVHNKNGLNLYFQAKL